MPVCLALGAPLAGCDAAGVDSEQLDIVGGHEAAAGTWSSMVAIDRLGDSFGPFWCGGTYVAPGWVLTAAHCFDGDQRPTSYQVIADRHDLTGTGGRVVAVTRIIRHPSYNTATNDNDIALLELASTLPLPLVSLAGRYEMNGVVQGEPATVTGWGATSEGGASSSTLQEAEVDVIGVGTACEDASDYTSITDNQICIGVLAGGRDTCQGDSGGPAFLRRGTAWVQIGITSWGIGCARADLPGVYTLVSSYRTWIAQQTGRGRLRYTAGNFDGDSDTDLVITTASGSYWYFSSGDGSWTYPYTRTDLPFGEAEYTPGDFNGDGKTDLVITTASGSYWYFSNGDGTWSVPYTRHDLPLGAVRYVPGDFNADGRTDLVITTASGSYWYFSNGDGTWTYPYTRHDLPLGKVRYTAGDFDGNGRTDLVITTMSGSYWYFSSGDGTWTYPYTRHDLPLGGVSYTAGRFDNNARTDLVITTASGSYWYFSNGDGTWTYPYTRHDLPL
jgi:hypothetical protein